jgi:uncharacterized membrane protein YphA (DoxX/SURF4 family)
MHRPAPQAYSDELPRFAFEIIVALLALVVALVWTVLDRRRREYRRLSAWLYSLVRFALAMEMIAYGLSKIFPVQFEGRVNLVALATPLGVLTPQNLLWSFMGFSRLYTVFVGVGEFAGAVMLCFRRTATLGALLLIAILANVFVMNVAYDVPVKVGSANLLAMAVLVAAYDARRLFDFFVLRKPADASRIPPIFRSRRANVAAGLIGSTVVVLLFCFNSITHEMIPETRQNGPSAPTPALFGIYDVEQMSRNGGIVPPLRTDSIFWNRIVFERFGRTIAQTLRGTAIVFDTQLDSVATAVTMTELAETDGMRTWTKPKGRRFMFTYSMPDSQHLTLRGSVSADSLTVVMRRVDAAKYRLTSHHWGGWGGG